MSDDNYYKGPCAHCHGTGWYCGAACWRCAGEGTAIRNREETENGEHRTADTPASGGAAEQPGGGAGQAAAYYKSVYDTCIRTGYDSRTAHNLAVACAYGTQQGTDLMYSLAGQSSYHQALAQAQALQQQNFLAQNAPWANQYGMPYGLPYATTSMPAITGGGPFTSGLVQQWVAPQPPEPVEDAGISAGEILGHRAWAISDDGYLHSMAVTAIWGTDGLMEGDPETCDQGVHAFKTQQQALQEYGSISGCHAFGRVALWGVVIEHEIGYRAQYAKIIAIDMVVGEKWLRANHRSLADHIKWLTTGTLPVPVPLLQRLRQTYNIPDDGIPMPPVEIKE